MRRKKNTKNKLRRGKKRREAREENNKARTETVSQESLWYAARMMYCSRARENNTGK